MTDYRACKLFCNPQLFHFTPCSTWLHSPLVKLRWHLTPVEQRPRPQTSSCSLLPSAVLWRPASGTSLLRRNSMTTDWTRAPNVLKDITTMVSGKIRRFNDNIDSSIAVYFRVVFFGLLLIYLHCYFVGDPLGLPTRLTLEFSAFEV